jgi:hypothetical protein
MTTTSDDDGTTPVDPGDAHPVPSAYGSRALADHDDTDTAPIVGLPLVPPPVDPVVTASLGSWPPGPAEPVATPAYADPPARVEPEPVPPEVVAPEPVAPEVVAPQASADGHPTAVLAAGAAGAAYVSDDVLPARPVGRSHRASREPASSARGRRDTGLRRTGPTPLGRVVLPLILALVSGVAIVAGWMHLQDDRAASSSPSASASSATVGSHSPTPTPTVSVSPSPSAVVSTPPGVVASSPAASGTATSSPAPKLDRSVPVVVLNSTSRAGLAARVAAQLRTDGWTVVSVGNFRGTLAITTVYAEGHVDAVATMQADLPTKDRHKSPFGAMNPKWLTVVVGLDYPRR